MTDDPGFYDRALRRLDRIVLVLAGAVVIAMAVREGWRGERWAQPGAPRSLCSRFGAGKKWHRR